MDAAIARKKYKLPGMSWWVVNLNCHLKINIGNYFMKMCKWIRGLQISTVSWEWHLQLALWLDGIWKRFLSLVFFLSWSQLKDFTRVPKSPSLTTIFKPYGKAAKFLGSREQHNQVLNIYKIHDTSFDCGQGARQARAHLGLLPLFSPYLSDTAPVLPLILCSPAEQNPTGSLS